jgi:ribose transport system permease protein
MYSAYSKTLVPFLIAAMLIIAGEFMSPGFAGMNHILILLKISALLGILVLAQTVVILSGGEGIDLSVGAIASISAIMAGVLVNGQDFALLKGVPVALASGFLLGLINGLGVAVFNVPPLIMTLGMAR